MENKIMMPASYNVLSCEEMTYTEGGASMAQALAAWFIPPYAWVEACVGLRNYRRSNPDNWFEEGLDALQENSSKNARNALFNSGCAYWFTFINIATFGVGFVPAALIICS